MLPAVSRPTPHSFPLAPVAPFAPVSKPRDFPSDEPEGSLMGTPPQLPPRSATQLAHALPAPGATTPPMASIGPYQGSQLQSGFGPGQLAPHPPHPASTQPPSHSQNPLTSQLASLSQPQGSLSHSQGSLGHQGSITQHQGSLNQHQGSLSQPQAPINHSQGAHSQGAHSQGTPNQPHGSLSHQGSLNQPQGALNHPQGSQGSQGSLSHQGSVNQAQGSLNQGSLSQGSLSQGSLNQGSLNQGSLNHGSNQAPSSQPSLTQPAAAHQGSYSHQGAPGASSHSMSSLGLTQPTPQLPSQMGMATMAPPASASPPQAHHSTATPAQPASAVVEYPMYQPVAPSYAPVAQQSRYPYMEVPSYTYSHSYYPNYYPYVDPQYYSQQYPPQPPATMPPQMMAPMLEAQARPMGQRKRRAPSGYEMKPETAERNRCRICQKQFKRPSSLQTHYYSHTGEKIFKCPWNGCGKQFSVKSNMTRHYRLHERDYSHGNSP
ncbi:hypothetical protein DICA4_E02696 [Diutina catenulata]